jgi:peptidoglycan/LPS O-acetylase OafA/YrhL
VKPVALPLRHYEIVSYRRSGSDVNAASGSTNGGPKQHPVRTMIGKQHSHSERVESLDLLRGLAAFAVMIPHFFMYYLANASAIAEIISVTAVEVFFVLSGFVLGPQIVLCARRKNWPTLRTFLLRRWMRTIPSYLVALLAISVIFGQIGSLDFFRYASYLQNLFSQHNARDYYPVAWSLSVEEWYYVAFPPFLLLYGKLTRGASESFEYVGAALVFILFVTLARAIYGDTADWGEHVRRVVAFRVDSIAYGFLLYLILQPAKFEWNATLRSLAFLFLVVTTALLLHVNLQMLESGAAWPKHVHPFASAAFGMSTVTFFLSINSLLRTQWMKAVATYLGHISYPVYLFHLAILFTLARFLSPHNDAWHFLLYAGTVVLFTTLFFHGFEKPILASRPRYRQVTVTGVAPIHDPEQASARH